MCCAFSKEAHSEAVRGALAPGPPGAGQAGRGDAWTRPGGAGGEPVGHAGLDRAYPVVFGFHRDLPILATLNFPLGVLFLRVDHKAVGFGVKGLVLRLNPLLFRLAEEGSGHAKHFHFSVAAHGASCKASHREPLPPGRPQACTPLLYDGSGQGCARSQEPHPQT